MAPQPLFGVSPSFLNKLLDVGSRESRDPVKGVKPGTLASMLNRYHNPQFGSSGSWLNPGQYEVLKKGGFNPSNPSIEKARAYYSTPEGQQELSRTAEQLGGVTDFRSTRYLRDTGNLLSYSTNLIPAVVQGERRFLTPQKLKEFGATPDLSENTFFNERKRPPTKEWWKNLASGTSTGAIPAAPVASTPVQKGNQQAGSLLQSIMKYIPMAGAFPGLSSLPAVEQILLSDSQDFLNAYKMFFNEEEEA